MGKNRAGFRKKHVQEAGTRSDEFPAVLLWTELAGGGWGRIVRGALGQEVDRLVG